MIKAEGNKMVEVDRKHLKLYTFVANFNPIYGCNEPEATTVKIAGTDYAHAYDRLTWLVGGKGRAEKFYLLDEQPYE